MLRSLEGPCRDDSAAPADRGLLLLGNVCTSVRTKNGQEVTGDKHVQYETRQSFGKGLKLLFAQELEMEW